MASTGGPSFLFSGASTTATEPASTSQGKSQQRPSFLSEQQPMTQQQQKQQPKSPKSPKSMALENPLLKSNSLFLAAPSLGADPQRRSPLAPLSDRDNRPTPLGTPGPPPKASLSLGTGISTIHASSSDPSSLFPVKAVSASVRL